jgi:hypothetical protein
VPFNTEKIWFYGRRKTNNKSGEKKVFMLNPSEIILITGD